MTSPLRAYITSLSPQSFWPFDETSGTVANDEGSLAKNGTYTNTPTLNQTGLLPYDSDPSVSFASASSQYVVVGTSTASYSFIQNTGTFSAGVLFKPIDYTASIAQVLFSNSSGASNKKGFWFTYTNSVAGYTKGMRTLLSYNHASLYGAEALNIEIISSNGPHFMVLVGDGNNIYHYLNGQCVGGIKITTKSTGDSTVNLNIARTDTGANYVNGNLQYPFILNTTLTPAQVEEMYWKSQHANATIGTPLSNLANGTYHLSVYNHASRGSANRVVWGGNVTLTGGTVSTQVTSAVPNGNLAYCVLTSQPANQTDQGANTFAGPLVLAGALVLLTLAIVAVVVAVDKDFE